MPTLEILVHDFTLGLAVDETAVQRGIADVNLALSLDSPAALPYLPVPDDMSMALLIDTPNPAISLRVSPIDFSPQIDTPSLTGLTRFDAVNECAFGLGLDVPQAVIVAAALVNDIDFALAFPGPNAGVVHAFGVSGFDFALSASSPAAAVFDSRPRYAAPYFDVSVRAPEIVGR